MKLKKILRSTTSAKCTFTTAPGILVMVIMMKVKVYEKQKCLFTAAPGILVNVMVIMMKMASCPANEGTHAP